MCRGATSNMKTLTISNRVNRHRKVIKVETGISLKYFVVFVVVIVVVKACRGHMVLVLFRSTTTFN